MDIFQFRERLREEHPALYSFVFEERATSSLFDTIIEICDRVILIKRRHNLLIALEHFARTRTRTIQTFSVSS